MKTNNDFIHGLKIKGRCVVHNDIIIITQMAGYTNLAMLFEKGIIDEVIIKFKINEEYNVLLAKIFPKKNGTIISKGQRYGRSKEEEKKEEEHTGRKKRRYIEFTETNIQFVKSIEESNAEFYVS